MADPPDPPHALHRRLQALLRQLDEVIPSSSQSPLSSTSSAGAVAAALVGLKQHLSNNLNEVHSLPALLVKFSHFLQHDLLSFPVPAAPVVTAAAAAAEDHGGDDEEGQERRRLRNLLSVTGEVMGMAVDEVLGLEDGKTRKVWEEALFGVLEGVKDSYDEFKQGKPTIDELAYRSLLATIMFPPLINVVLPNPDGLPTSSAVAIDDGGHGAGLPVEAKYIALDVLGDLCSKHEANKEVLKTLMPAEILGRLLAYSLDYHITNLTIELAFRLMPGKPRKGDTDTVAVEALLRKRKDWIDGLFTNPWFGESYKMLRAKFEATSARSWETDVEQILLKMGDARTKRPQPFRALSITYNGIALLAREGEDELSPIKLNESLLSLEQVAAGGYEAVTVFICRHNIGAVVPALGDEEAPYERLVVDMSGIEKVYVEDLGLDPDLIRVTFLSTPSSPLRIHRQPHPAEPTHVGRGLASARDSQASSVVQRMHKLELIVPGSGNNLVVLRQVLEERATIYPKLGDSLRSFPVRPPSQVPPPAASTSGAPAAAPRSGHAAHQPPAANAPSDDGWKPSTTSSTAKRNVTFAATPDDTLELRHDRDASKENVESAVKRTARKASEAVDPVRQTYAESPSSTSGAMGVEAASSSAEGRSTSQEESQEARRKKEEEVARLASLKELEERSRSSMAGSSDAGPVDDGPGFSIHEDEPTGGEEYGGGFDDARQQPLDGAVDDPDDLPHPSGVARGLVAAFPTSEPAHPASEATKTKATPAAYPLKASEKNDQPSAAAATTTLPSRPRASTVGKPRPAEEEDVTPSQRALGRKESESNAIKAKETEKRPALRRTASSDLSELESSDEDLARKKDHKPALVPSVKRKKEAASGPTSANVVAPTSTRPKKSAATSAAAPGQSPRRSPRLSSVEPSSDPLAIGTTSKSIVKKPPPSKAGKKVVASPSHSTADRPRRLAAPSKKVVQPAQSKKRGRDDEEENGGDASSVDEEADEEEDHEEEEKKKKKKGTGGASKGKAKEKGAAPTKTKKAPAPKKVVKKRKVAHSRSPSGSQKDDGDAVSAAADDDDEVTDYESYPAGGSTLEDKKGGVSPARRYGREKKVVKPVGGKKKAGQKKKEDDESASKGGKKGRSSSKGKAKAAEKESEEEQEGETETGQTTGRTTRSKAKPKKVVKPASEEGVSGKADDDARQSLPPKSKDKRVSDDIPPPRDVPPHKSPFRRPPPVDGQHPISGGTSPRKDKEEEKALTFQQFIRSSSENAEAAPQDDSQPFGDLEGSFLVDRAGQAEAASQTGSYGGGFDGGFDNEPLPSGFHFPSGPSARRNPSFDTQDQQQLGGHHLGDRRSYSPLLDLAKDDTFVERAMGEVEETAAELVSSQPPQQIESLEVGDQSVREKQPTPPKSPPTVTGRAQVGIEEDKSQPKILVADTQSSGVPTPAKPVAEVARPSVEGFNVPERGEEGDVEMEDAQHDVEPRHGAEGEEEQVDTDDLYSATGPEDDSGGRFAVPMDEGVQADEEEMAAPGADQVASVADASSDRQSELARQQISAEKPVSAPLPSSGAVRPLLVEKPPRRPRSVEAPAADLPPRPPQQQAPLRQQPQASTSKAHPALPAPKTAVAKPPPPPRAKLPVVPAAASTRAALPPPVAPKARAQPKQALQPPPLPAAAPATGPLPRPILQAPQPRPNVPTISSTSAILGGRQKKHLRPGARVLSFSKARNVSFAPQAYQTRKYSFEESSPVAPLPWQILGKGVRTTRKGGKKKPSAASSATREKARGKGKEREKVQEATAAAVQEDEQPGRDEWDEDDRARFDIYSEFARIQVEKDREKKATLLAHNESAADRFERQLGRHLAAVHGETDNIIDAARSYVSTAETASAPTSRLAQLLTRARNVNAKLWLEAETELVELRKELGT